MPLLLPKWIPFAPLSTMSTTRSRLNRVRAAHPSPIVLSVLSVGNSTRGWQIRSEAHLVRWAETLGVQMKFKRLPEDAGALEVVAAINALNYDRDVKGIALSRPFWGKSANELKRFHEAVHPHKDVEGMHPASIGRVVSYAGKADGDRFMWPTTARAAVELCAAVRELEGMEALIVGSSDVVVKPLLSLLQTRGATVTVCSPDSAKLPVRTRSADAVFSAVSSPDFQLEGDMMSPGSVLIDLGFQLKGGHIIGDARLETVGPVVAHVASVVHGVASLRAAYLFENLATAAESQIVY